MKLNSAACLGTHDVLFITLDTLRFDVAEAALSAGDTPHLANLLPDDGWECRHSPASFTYAAHAAFFAGFLPTPAFPREKSPESHSRLFATSFPGSETTGQGTLVFDSADIVTGFSEAGYRTICVGGVGFFNKQSALGSALPNLFAESWWEEGFGVTCLESTAHQVACALDRRSRVPVGERVFLFINVSAMHQPNCGYLHGTESDSPASQQAALAYVDSQLGLLFDKMRAHAPVLTIICGDHGTAYGEDGYLGHRIGHPTVWNVPYLETILSQQGAS